MLTCLICNKQTSGYSRVCEDCDSHLLVSHPCEKCGFQIKAEPNEPGVVSAIAGRLRTCPKCNYNFFIPTILAEVLWSQVPGVLDKTSIEWAFYMAWYYQIGMFGGSAAAVDCGEDAVIEFRKTFEVSTENWGDLYWPDDRYTLPLWLFEHFDSSPQLTYSEIIEEDDENLTVELAPNDSAIPVIENQEAFTALISSLSATMEAETDSEYQSIVAATLLLLSSENCL